jgi:tetratricopeptide (TPR) repeat protein
VAKAPETPAVIEEFETGAERLARWIASHPWAAAGVAALVLGTAGAVGGYWSFRTASEERASDALDAARVEYLEEMGAGPTALEVPELANPKAAQEIRERALERFRAVAERESGTAAGALARFEMADLLDALGRRDEIPPLLALAAEKAPSPTLRAIAQRRLGYVHEEAGRFVEAAAAFEAAAAVRDYALRYFALADAARCTERAGRRAEALALYDRIASEAPELALPEHQAAQIRELRAAGP